MGLIARKCRTIFLMLFAASRDCFMSITELFFMPKDPLGEGAGRELFQAVHERGQWALYQGCFIGLDEHDRELPEAELRTSLQRSSPG